MVFFGNENFQILFGKMIDILSFHTDYLLKHKITDISLDVTGVYVQMALAEMGVKASTFTIKILIFALIAAL